MHSFYADGDRILGEEAAHLSKVLRLKAGEEIVAIEKGQRTLARLTSVGKEEARFEPLRPLPSGEAACRVTLYQGLCKGEKMEYVVQKCTEMGVHAIVPVAMARRMFFWASISMVISTVSGFAPALTTSSIMSARIFLMSSWVGLLTLRSSCSRTSARATPMVEM